MGLMRGRIADYFEWQKKSPLMKKNRIAFTPPNQKIVAIFQLNKKSTTMVKSEGKGAQ